MGWNQKSFSSVLKGAKFFVEPECNEMTRLLRSNTIQKQVFLSHSGCTPNWEIHNPYQNVNGANDGQYKANFHAHTKVSDVRLNPQNVVDIYHSLGYSILAITDHNSMSFS